MRAAKRKCRNGVYTVEIKMLFPSTIKCRVTLYHDNSQSMTENVSELAEALKQRDTHDIAMWLADVFSEGTEPEQKKAMEILKKLTEYKPLAKVEDNDINGMEEQNYNMVDNVRPAARTSLKAHLAEKKELVSGQGKDQVSQENIKNSQREM